MTSEEIMEAVRSFRSQESNFAELQLRILAEIAFQLAVRNEQDKPDLCPDCGHPKGRCLR